MAEAEEAELASSSKGKAKAATPKVTAAQLAAARESERKAQEDALAAKKLAARKEARAHHSSSCPLHAPPPPTPAPTSHPLPPRLPSHPLPRCSARPYASARPAH